jgi:hypothetical protein
MIHLNRPTAPASLARKAAIGVAKLLADWSAGKPLTFQASIYGASSVKAALRKAQHGKCAYCETRLVRDYGQVEHYRPKAGWKQERIEALKKPGYFWLAYEWANLFFSCAMCNDAGHKANVFPLTATSQRASPTNTDVAGEQPLLLSPFDGLPGDQPEDHIAWKCDVPRPKNGSARGLASINTFKLDKDEALVDERRSHLDKVKIMLEACETDLLPIKERTQLVTVLLASIEDAAPYAAMIRANLKLRILAL